jgi:lysophospholipase L1-like esterase
MSDLSAFTLFLAGDSTMADQPADVYPLTGWGQMLHRFVPAEIKVANHAMSGRSSLSFINEGRLDAIMREAEPNDCLIIQFGHNDEKMEDPSRYTDPEVTYPAMLRRYLEAARSRGMRPVLATPVQRRTFATGGTLYESHGAYPDAVRKLAAEEGVPLLDLAAKTKELYERLGPEKSRSLFVHAKPGELPNYPDGAEDNTHFSERGALRVAEIAAEGLAELGILPYVRRPA